MGEFVYLVMLCYATLAILCCACYIYCICTCHKVPKSISTPTCLKNYMLKTSTVLTTHIPMWYLITSESATAYHLISMGITPTSPRSIALWVYFCGGLRLRPELSPSLVLSCPCRSRLGLKPSKLRLVLRRRPRLGLGSGLTVRLTFRVTFDGAGSSKIGVD